MSPALARVWQIMLNFFLNYASNAQKLKPQQDMAWVNIPVPAGKE